MDYELTRREFLEVSATAAGMAPFAELRLGRELTAEERATLLTIVRTIFPHDQVGDAPYIKAVAAIEKRCRADSIAFRDVTEGAAALFRASGGHFSTVGDRTRVSLLKAREDSSFFRVVYCEALESLYGSTDMLSLFTATGRDT